MITRQIKLTLKEKIGYALGDTAANIAWRTIIPFLPIFYTDVFGLETAVVATLMTLVRLGDGITDILMGVIADRTKSKWGKFRPWLLWTAVPFGVSLVLQFTTPNISLTGKIIWAYATSIFYSLIYTANNIPYSALMGVMTTNIKERTELSSFRFFGAYFGGVIATIGVIALVDYLGKGNQNLGYQYTMYVLAFILSLFSIITFLTTKERVPELNTETPNVKDDIKDILTNRPWIVLLFLGLIFVTYNIIKGGSVMFYFTHYVKDTNNFFGSLSNWGGNNGLAGLYLLMLLVVSMISTFFAPYLTKFFGKVKLFNLSIITSAIAVATIYFLKPDQIGLLFLFGGLSEFGAGIMPILFFAMLGDASDYSEYKNGRRATGLIFSAGTLAMKFGTAIANGLTMIILGIFNYDGKIVIKTEEMLTGIRLNMSLVPALFILLGIVALLFYPLTKTKMFEVTKALKKQRDF